MEATKEDIKIQIVGYITKLKTAVASAKTQIKSLSTSVVASSNNMVKATSESLRRLGNTLVGAAGSALIGFVYPIVNGFKEVVSAGMEMEDSIQRVMSVFNNIDGAEAFNTLKTSLVEFVKSLAGTTKYDFLDISETMYTLVQSGQDYNEIIASTPAILELATAQMAELDTTAQLVISTLNGYNMTVEESDRVTNALAATTSNTMLRLNDLTTSSRYVNATLGAMWGEEVFERGLALTGMLRDWGRTGMQSGRIIRDIFQSLLNPTAEVSRILENNNINIYKNSDAINQLKNKYESAKKALDNLQNSGTATDNQILNQKILVEQLGYELENTYSEGLIGLDDLLEQFADARKRGMSEGELFAIGGKQSGGAFVQILDNLPKYYDLTEAITGTNEATRQAGVVAESASYQIGLLRSALVSAEYFIYEKMINSLKDMAVKLIDLMPTIQEIGGMFAGEFAKKLSTIVDVVINIVKWFDNLDNGNKKLIVGFTTTIATIGLIVTPLMLLGGIISWNIASILTLVTSLTALNAKFILSSKNAMLFLGSLKSSLIIIYSKAIDILTTSYKLNLAKIKSVNWSLEVFAIRVQTAIINSLKLAYATGASVLTKSFGLLKNGVKSTNTYLSAFITKLKIANIQTTLFNSKLKITQITSILSKDGIKGLATLLPTLAGGIGGVTAALSTGIPALLAATATIAPLIIAIGAIIAAIVLLYTAIRDNWQGIGDFIKYSIDYILNVFKPLIDAVYNVMSAFGNLFEAIKGGTAKDILEGFGEVIGGVIRLIGSIPYTIATTLGTIIGDAVRIISNWLGEVGKDVSDKGVGQFLYEIAMSIIQGAIEMGASFVDGFIKGITGANADDKIKNSLSNSNDMNIKGVEDGTAYANGINEGLSDNIKTLAEIKAEKEAAMARDVITAADRPEELDPLLQAQISDIRGTSYAVAGEGGFHAPTYAEAQKFAEEQGIAIGDAMYQLNQQYNEANTAYQNKLISELRTLYLPRFDEQQMMNSAQKAAHEGGYGYEQWSISPEDYSVEAVNNASIITDLTAQEIENRSDTKMKSVGNTISNDIGDGVIENSEEYKKKVSSIYVTTETVMTNMSKSAYSWGSQFISSLVNGMNSQYASFTNMINNLKNQMIGLQFIANPATATNAGLIDTLNQLNTSIANIGGNSGGNYNININVSDIVMKEEIGADELAYIISNSVENKINTINRRTTI